MIIVVWNSDRVSAGRMIERQPPRLRRLVFQPPTLTVPPRPDEGSHCRVTAKM